MPDLAGTPWPVVKAPTEVELTLTWVNPQSSSQGGAEVISDNLDVWQYESPSPNVVAWGSNRYGQTNVPAGLTNVVAVAGGAGHTLALRADGTVVAWGNDDFGKINVPAGLTNVVAIDAGGFRGFGGNEGGSLALRADGTMVAWGGTYGGSPGALAGWTNVVAVAAGGDTSLALRADGTVIAWGNNDFGKADVPAGLSNVVAVAAGGWHSLALRSDGTVVAWGAGLTNSGSWPDLGQSIDPAGLTNAVGVSAGLDYSLALRADGTAVAWGQYWGGSPEVPMTVPDGLTNLVAVAAGFWHSLALLGDGPPVVKASLSHPTLSASGFSVSLPTQSGRVFALEYKDSLTDAAWTPLPLVAGTGHERTLTDPTAAGTQRFYRVRRW